MEAVWPGEFPVLNAGRVLLRRVSKKDSNGIYRCFSNPDTMRYLGTPLDDPLSISGIVEDYMEGYDEGCSIVWALENRKTGEFLGTAGFENFSFLDLKAETGFTLLESHQGQGYMSEALKSIMEFGFETIMLNRIEATIHPDNAGALKLVEKLGFSLEGRLRKSVFFNGSFHDQLVFSVLKEDRSLS